LSATQKDILKKIKLTRLCKDLTQRDLAKSLNISTPTYSRFEKGKNKLNFELLEKVSALLNIEPFVEIRKEETNNLVNESVEIYEKSSGTESINQQLESIIKLLEKQEKLNHEILDKLKNLRYK